jgi:hypothetical protein
MLLLSFKIGLNNMITFKRTVKYDIIFLTSMTCTSARLFIFGSSEHIKMLINEHSINSHFKFQKISHSLFISVQDYMVVNQYVEITLCRH